MSVYRDLIGDPEKIEYNGREWWLQTYCRWDGTVKTVNLYDGDGDLVGEFQSTEEAMHYMADAQ